MNHVNILQINSVLTVPNAQSNECFYDRKMALFDGGCYQCGQFCEHCEFEYIVSTDSFINRCYTCYSSSLTIQEYFVSFDGVNCLRNTITSCLYSF